MSRCKQTHEVWAPNASGPNLRNSTFRVRIDRDHLVISRHSDISRESGAAPIPVNTSLEETTGLVAAARRVAQNSSSNKEPGGVYSARSLTIGQTPHRSPDLRPEYAPGEP